MNKVKEPLYRKENKRVRKLGSHIDFGGDYRHERHTKANGATLIEGVTRASMHAKVKRGFDYTPLYRFLLSKVGEDWPKVHSEAVSRLDKEDPIWFIVAKNPDEREEFTCLGENSYYSGLYIDDAGKLQKVKPDLCAADINAKYPGCECCTYTLNGVPFKTRARMNVDAGRHPWDGID